MDKDYSFSFFKNLLPFTTLKISVISKLICRFCSLHHRTRFEVSNNLKLLYLLFQSGDAFVTKNLKQIHQPQVKRKGAALSYFFLILRFGIKIGDIPIHVYVMKHYRENLEWNTVQSGRFQTF